MSTHLWHPFADMAAVKDDEVVIVRGRGARVWDADGREYVDARAGLWYAAVGHGRTEIADAVAAQMRELAAFDTFDRLANRPALELADRVSALAPFPDAAVFFGSGGSDAVDTAAKLARRYWHALGQPDKRLIVHRQHSYHGMNAYGTSLAGIATNREGFGTLIADVASVPYDDPAALGALFEERAGEIAAFIGEPVIGAGGILHPPEGYWAAVQELCRKHDVLLIADEVVTGFGRLGRWFGCQRLGIDPDMITCAKAITSGYLPLGAVIISSRIQEPFWTEPGRAIFRHGFTYSGHPAACAAGLANLDLIEREELVDRVAEMESVLARAIEPLTELPLVSEVRAGLGLLAAVEIDPDARAADPGLVERIVTGCRRERSADPRPCGARAPALTAVRDLRGGDRDRRRDHRGRSHAGRTRSRLSDHATSSRSTRRRRSSEGSGSESSHVSSTTARASAVARSSAAAIRSAESTCRARSRATGGCGTSRWRRPWAYPRTAAASARRCFGAVSAAARRWSTAVVSESPARLVKGAECRITSASRRARSSRSTAPAARATVASAAGMASHAIPTTAARIMSPAIATAWRTRTPRAARARGRSSAAAVGAGVPLGVVSVRIVVTVMNPTLVAVTCQGI